MIEIDKLAPPASPSSTKAVDIVAMVGMQEIPSALFGPRYTLSPAPGDEQAYAALRDTLESTRRIGIALVVLQAQPQLVALLPHGDTLVLNTLRCGTDAGVNRADRLHELASLTQCWSIGPAPDPLETVEAIEEAAAQVAQDALLERMRIRHRRHPQTKPAARTVSSHHSLRRRRA